MGKNSNIDPHDGIDLGQYRSSVARLLRLLIRARLTQEPEFLSAKELQRWNLSSDSSTTNSMQLLLHEAETANDILYNEILGPGNSTGIALDDPKSELKEAVVGVMTGVWSWARTWISNAPEMNQPIGWDYIIPPQIVQLIRDELDKLPHPETGDATGEGDGPVPPKWFQWKGRTAELTPKPWGLVTFLWDRHSWKTPDGHIQHSADMETVAKRVWGDENVAEGRAIPSAASQANAAFEQAGIPIRLSVARNDDDGHHYVALTVRNVSD